MSTSPGPFARSHNKSVSWNFPNLPPADDPSSPKVCGGLGFSFYQDPDTSDQESDLNHEEHSTPTKSRVVHAASSKATSEPQKPLLPIAPPNVQLSRPRSKDSALRPIEVNPAVDRKKTHRSSYSTSSSSSSNSLNLHQPILHLNLPPCSPSLPPDSPTRSQRSRSPTLKGHGYRSSISSCSSQNPRSKFVFPPPAPGQPSATFPISPPASSSISDDSSVPPSYPTMPLNEMQNIFVTLANKERRLLEAREQMLLAEKDLQDFKNQWNSVLNGNEEDEELTQKKLQSAMAPPKRTASPVTSCVPEPATEEPSPRHTRLHGRIFNSVPEASVPSLFTIKMLNKRSLGHTRDFDFGKDCVQPQTSSVQDTDPDESKSSTSIFTSISSFFRGQASKPSEFPDETQVLVTPTKVSCLSTPSSCSTLSTISIEPGTPPQLHTSPPTVASPESQSFFELVYPYCESSFIVQYFTTYGIPSSSCSVRSTHAEIHTLASPTRSKRSVNFQSKQLARPRALTLDVGKLALLPPSKLRARNSDFLHQPLASIPTKLHN